MTQYKLTEKEIRLYALLITAGLFIAIIWGVTQCSSSSEYKAEKDKLKVRVDSLLTIKNNLEKDIEEITSKFDSAETRNQQLTSNINELDGVIKQKDILISKYQKDAKNVAILKNQIKELLAFKAELQNKLEELNRRSDKLLAENQRLKDENSKLLQQNEQLTAKAEVPSDYPPAIKPLLTAESFRVEVLRRKEKLTVKSRRSRQLEVSFNLPKESGMEGENTLYLCITDQNFNPIQDQDNKDIEVDLGKGRKVKTVSQMSQSVNLSNLPKRIVWKYALENKLKAGYYYIEIYSESAMVGGVQFRLI